jgi:zinc D-Ala-D-Ala carboxypeptidase
MANDPSESEIENLRACAKTSFNPCGLLRHGGQGELGYRHPLVNSKVNGSTMSDHCKGFAADIEIPGIPNADLAQWIADNCEFRQLILEFYTVGVPDSGWVHVSFNAADNKKQVLTATKQNGKTVYLQGLVA